MKYTFEYQRAYEGKDGKCMKLWQNSTKLYDSVEEATTAMSNYVIYMIKEFEMPQPVQLTYASE